MLNMSGKSICNEAHAPPPESRPSSPQLEKALMQQQRLSPANNKQINKKENQKKKKRVWVERVDNCFVLNLKGKAFSHSPLNMV